MLVAVDPATATDGAVSIPETVAFNGAVYSVAALAPYAFYLSGATDVALPASITSVDNRAFRTSDVARVEVDPANNAFASFDGCLYDSQRTSLLLIPGGRGGAVRIPDTATSVPAAAFSHCAEAGSIAVDEGSPAFSSWEGLLYDASGATLLRVPAGATEITIRDGCTSIAAGAMEGCAKLERINAPATVTSISPDVFTSVPTVSLPASAVADDSSKAETQASLHGEANSGVASGLPDQVNDSTDFAPQLTAMVALSTTDDDLPKIDLSAINIALPDASTEDIWRNWGFENLTIGEGAATSLQSAATYAAASSYFYDEATLYRVVGSSVYTSPGGTWFQVNNKTMTVFRFYQGSVWFDSTSGTCRIGVNSSCAGVQEVYWGTSPNSLQRLAPSASYSSAGGNANIYFRLYGHVKVIWNANGGSCSTSSSTVALNSSVVAPTPTKSDSRFVGWYDNSGNKVCDAGQSTPAVTSTSNVTYYAKWVPADVDISFDTSSEPDDEDYPGDEKSDETITGIQMDAGEQVVIEDPKRPGYVFEGWVIPTEDGTEAIDQDLVYQDSDGKWYVDASKLPDYAGDDGRVELTARWTSVISVDVPQSVTFYADTVTQNQGSREGAASSAFGQSKVSNQSEVDLRVVGLESSAVKTTDATLGADSILKKAEAATPSTSAGKLLSLYPSAKQWTADELQDPDAVGGTKAANAVDFDLDDILLEKSFSSDAFTIPAGDTLNMGYRLNLTETGQQLDYDKLATLEDGQSAALANVSYCFAAGEPVFWTEDDDGSTLGLAAIKADAEKIAAGDAAITEKYTRWMNDDHRFHVKWYDKGVSETDDPTARTIYEVRIIGIAHDNKADGSGKAGLTFQLVDCLNEAYPFAPSSSAASWSASTIRGHLNGGAIWSQMPLRLKGSISTVDKVSYDGGAKLRTQDQLFLPSISELVTAGTVWPNGSDSASNGWGELAKMRSVSPQYAFWKAQGVNGCTSNASLSKNVNGAARIWATRSVSSFEKGGKYVALVSDTGIPNGSQGLPDSMPRGISPCFCL